MKRKRPSISLINKITLILVAAVLSTLTPALADDTDWLEYTPTGDRLFDTYAVELLNRLAEASTLTEMVQQSPRFRYIYSLDSIPEAFETDPCFWQLNAWESMLDARKDRRPRKSTLYFIEKAMSCDSNDQRVGMLNYQYQEMVLESNRTTFLAKGHDELKESAQNEELEYAGFGGEDEHIGFIPPTDDPGQALLWFDSQELVLADELVDNCPDESWAWYERAMINFKYGNWEDGLSDLDSGNQANNNRVPVSFPMSFINERIDAGEEYGGDIVLGLLIEKSNPQEVPNFIYHKEMLKNQFVRNQAGAALDELAIWHSYICRLGAMADAHPYQWLIAKDLESTLIEYLLTQSAHQISEETLDTLTSIETELQAVPRAIETVMALTDSTQLQVELEALNTEYGYDYGFSESEVNAFYDSEIGREYSIRASDACFKWWASVHKNLRSEPALQVRQLFSSLGSNSITDN